MAFIAKQPNGLYCRFSSVVDTVTDYNMTEQDYIELCKKRAEDEAREVLSKHVMPFWWVKDRFVPNNMTEEEFNSLIEKMSQPVEQEEQDEKEKDTEYI